MKARLLMGLMAGIKDAKRNSHGAIELGRLCHGGNREIEEGQLEVEDDHEFMMCD